MDKEKIRAFVFAALKKRKVDKVFGDDDSLLLSGALDSLFLVDLLLFLEKEFPQIPLRMELLGNEELDTINKIAQVLVKYA